MSEPTPPQGSGAAPPPPPPPPQGADGTAPPPPVPSAPGIDINALPAPIRDELLAPDPVALDTSNKELRDGLNQCPRCGSSDVRFLIATGMLHCNFCRYEWQETRVEEAFGLGDGLDQLSGTTIASGAREIAADAATMITMKCSACGAEVVIDTMSQVSARCHWCRHTLSLNEQIPNGAVPDAVLPFRVPHDDAVARIRQFVNKRRLFALGKFKKEFAPENVVGVYLPYLIVDARASSDLGGYGEVETGRHVERINNTTITYYDADVYGIDRHLDFTVDDLTIESSTERADIDTRRNTNNIINSILPFDTKNAVLWNADYLRGFTSEKRDAGVVQVTPEMEDQLMSIARAQVQPSVAGFDRGVRWEQEKLDVHGSRWVSMLLPVWLYSYYQPQKNLMHYIAVNGRTGETMGSIPVQQWKLVLASITVGTFIEGIAGWILWGTYS